jgi:5'-nucleotidase
VSSNLDFSKVTAVKDKLQSYLIIEKNGQKFGIFGLTTEEVTEISSPGKNITVKDHIAAAREAVAALQKKGINKIIALTHIGWDEDIKLANQVKGIDLIIGGHSHTLPSVYPTVITNVDPTFVVQAAAYNQYLGRLDLSFDKQGIITKQSGALAKVKDAAEDAEYVAKLQPYKAPIDQLKAVIIGKTQVLLDAERANIRTKETNFGNMVTDAFLAKAKPVNAGVVIVNGGSIRSSIPAGDISLGQIVETIPFNGELVSFDLSGEQLLAALENGVSQVEAIAGRFPQVAGIRFAWKPGNPVGSRIQSVDVRSVDGSYKPIDKAASYRIVSTSYLYGGGDGYAAFQKGMNVNYLGFIDYTVVMEYITQNSPVNPKVEGRITEVR